MNKQIYPFLLSLGGSVLLAGCGTLQPKNPEAKADIGSDWSAERTYASKSALPSWGDYLADAKLREVVKLALENNRDLRIALLNVEKARALYRIQRADRLPSVNAAGVLTRSGGSTAVDVKEYRTELGVAQFELDLFGRVKNLSDAALHSYLASEEGSRSVLLTLVAETAKSYLALVAANERVRLTGETVKSYEESLDLVRRRAEAGVASDLELYQATTQLASAKADAASYRALLSESRNALGLLAGAEIPSSLLPSEGSALPKLSAPPVALPSEVLLARPDIREAEEKLSAASANIGAARASFFPSISLTGAVGYASPELSALFDGDSKVWRFSPSVNLPIFQGGRLRANLKVAKADRDMALAGYEKAIQSGFREVSDALALSAADDERLAELETMERSASESLRLSRALYEAGRGSYMNVLDSQRSLFSAQLALLSTKLDREANLVTLYQSLGGGSEASTPNVNQHAQAD